MYPPHLCAWSKTELGWLSPTILNTPGQFTLSQVETSARAYKVTEGFPNGEYLLVENRQPIGFDQKIPSGAGGAGGLAIWHIDEAKPGNNDAGYPGQSGWPGNNRHYKVALLQADGRYQLEKPRSLQGNHGDAADLYRAEHVSRIGSATVPNTNAYQNGNVSITGNTIENVSLTGSTMTFNYSVTTD